MENGNENVICMHHSIEIQTAQPCFPFRLKNGRLRLGHILLNVVFNLTVLFAAYALHHNFHYSARGTFREGKAGGGQFYLFLP